MILSNPHTHTHTPWLLRPENIIGIILKDHVFSRFYKNDALGCVSYLGPPVSESIICLGTHTLAQFIPPGMLWLTCAIFLDLLSSFSSTPSVNCLVIHP